jgi:hypothetical protein
MTSDETTVTRLREAVAEALYANEVAVMYRYERSHEDRLLHADALIRALRDVGYGVVAHRSGRGIATSEAPHSCRLSSTGGE